MSYAAHFWMAPGVEVFAGVTVPSPPPILMRFPIRRPMNVADFEMATMAILIPKPQNADFRLAEWSASGNVAHYNLDSSPPDGWRWLVVAGKIQAERTQSARHLIPGGKPK